MRYLIIVQVESPIRQPHRQHAEATLHGLGLNKMWRVNWVPATDEYYGMIGVIPHMIRILDVVAVEPDSSMLKEYQKRAQRDGHNRR